MNEFIIHILEATLASLLAGLLTYMAYQLKKKITPEQLDQKILIFKQEITTQITAATTAINTDITALKNGVKEVNTEQERLSEMQNDLNTKVEKLPSADRFNLEFQRRDDEQKRTNKRLENIENKMDALPDKLAEIVKSAIKSGGK